VFRASSCCLARRTLLLGALLGGCGLEVMLVELPAPPSAQALLFVVDDPRGLSLTAVDLEAPGQARLPVVRDLDDGGEVHVLAYTESLRALGLEAGAVELVESGRGRPIPEPAQRFSMRLVAGGSLSWAPADGLPERLSEREIPAVRAPCPRLRVTPLLAMSTQQRSRAVELDDGDALVVLAPDAQWWRVKPTGDPVELTLTTPADFKPWSLARSSDGELWLGGEGGRIARGRLEQGLVELPKAPTAERLIALAPSPDSPASEVLAVGSKGSVFVWRRATETWSELLARDFKQDNGRGGALWLDLERALLIHFDGGLFSYDRRRPTEIEPLSVTLEIGGTGLLTLARSAAQTAMIGNDDASVFEWQPGGLRRIAMLPFDPGVLFAVGPDLVAMARGGFSASIGPDETLCSDVASDRVIGFDPFLSAPLGPAGARILVGRHGGGSGPLVLRVEPVP
jgi:hypothetical protein